MPKDSKSSQRDPQQQPPQRKASEPEGLAHEGGVNDLTGSQEAFRGGTLESQVESLRNLSGSQRQALLDRIGQTQGNLHVQRLMSAINQAARGSTVPGSAPSTESREIETDGEETADVDSGAAGPPALAFPQPPETPEDGDDPAEIQAGTSQIIQRENGDDEEEGEQQSEGERQGEGGEGSGRRPAPITEEELRAAGFVPYVPPENGHWNLAQRIRRNFPNLTSAHRIVVVTNRMYIYNSSGSNLLHSLPVRSGALPLSRGVYLSDAGRTVRFFRPREYDLARPNLQPLYMAGGEFEIERWVEISAEQLERFFGSASTRLAVFAIKPGAGPEESGGSERGDREGGGETPAEDRPEQEDSEAARQEDRERRRYRPSPTDYEFEGGEPTANFPAWPAELRGPDRQPAGGTGAFTMALNYSSGGGTLLSHVREAAHPANFRWELYDITQAVEGGASRESQRQALHQRATLGEAGADPRGEEISVRARTGRALEVEGEDLAEDIQSSGEGIRQGLQEGEMSSVFANMISGNPALLTVSAITGYGGVLIEAVPDLIGGYEFEREVPFRDQGVYLLRVVAQVLPYRGVRGRMVRRAASVATKVVSVEPIEQISQDIQDDARVQVLEAATSLGIELMSDEPDPEREAQLRRALFLHQMQAGVSVDEVLRDEIARTRQRMETTEDEAESGWLNRTVAHLEDIRDAVAHVPGGLMASADLSARATLEYALAQKRRELAQENARLRRGGHSISVLQERLTREIQDLERRLSLAVSGEERAGVHRGHSGGERAAVQEQLEQKREQLTGTRSPANRRRLEQEIAALEARLEAMGEERRLPSSVFRPQAHFVSSVTGRTYPLLLQIGVTTTEPGEYEAEITDVTAPSGDRYQGDGENRESAVWDAVEDMVGSSWSYGRGNLTIRMPPDLNYAVQTRDLRCHPTDWDLAESRLQDLLSLLAVIGLAVPPVGAAAGLVGAAISANNLWERFSEDRFTLDFQAVNDMVAILGALATGVSSLGRFRVVVEGEHFMLVGARRAAAGAALVERGAGYAGFLIGEADILHRFMQIQRQLNDGTISRSEARRQRTMLVFQAFRDAAIQFAGDAQALHDVWARGAETGFDPSTETRRPADVGEGDAPPRRPPEAEGGAETEAPTRTSPEPDPAGEGETSRREGPAPEEALPTDEPGHVPEPMPAPQPDAGGADRPLGGPPEQAAASEPEPGGRRPEGGDAPEPSVIASPIVEVPGRRGTVAEPLSLASPLERTRANQMASAGHRGATADTSLFGVFRGQMSVGGQVVDVAVKVFRERHAARFQRELAGAIAAEQTGHGPHIHGVVEIPGRPPGLGYAMEIVPGDFAEAMGGGRGEAGDAFIAGTRIGDRTYADLHDYSQRLLEQGYYYDGEVQGLIGSDGQWRPIDFGPIRELPAAGPDATPSEIAQIQDQRTRALQEHQTNVDAEHQNLQRLGREAQQRLAERQAGLQQTEPVHPDEAPAAQVEEAPQPAVVEIPPAQVVIDPVERTSAPEAQQRLQEAIESGADSSAQAEAAARLLASVGDWKGDLARMTAGMGEHQQAAEAALVEARTALIQEQAAAILRRFGVQISDVGTPGFGSDIDITITSVEQQPGFSGEPRSVAAQVRAASEAAAQLRDRLRQRVGGETDQVIDTNVYSYIGEGDVRPASEGERITQSEVHQMVGLAEQIRGTQGRGGRFRDFIRRLRRMVPRGETPELRARRAQMERILQGAQEFFEARTQEWEAAREQARQDAGRAAPRETVDRMAREALVRQKQAELSTLFGQEPPNVEAIARLQAEILWFEPDAYATRPAIMSAVGGQQRRGAGARDLSSRLTQAEAALRHTLESLESTTPRDEGRIRQIEIDLAYIQERQGRLAELDRAEVERDLAEIEGREARALGMTPETAARPPSWGEDPVGVRQRLMNAAAAASANLGMQSAHVAHAESPSGRVKAAVKYAGRILLEVRAMERMLGAREDATRRLMDLFTQSRWPIRAEDVSARVVDQMFIAFARQEGIRLRMDSDGRPVITDQVRQQFIRHMQRWARDAVDRLQSTAFAYEGRARAAEASVPEGG